MNSRVTDLVQAHILLHTSTSVSECMTANMHSLTDVALRLDNMSRYQVTLITTLRSHSQLT